MKDCCYVQISAAIEGSNISKHRFSCDHRRMLVRRVGGVVGLDPGQPRLYFRFPAINSEGLVDFRSLVAGRRLDPPGLGAHEISGSVHEGLRLVSAH